MLYCLHVVVYMFTCCYCLHLVLFTCSNVYCLFVCMYKSCFSLTSSYIDVFHSVFSSLFPPFLFTLPPLLSPSPPLPSLPSLPSLLLPSPRAPVWELSEAEDEGIQADLQSMRSKVSDNRTSATSTLSEFSTSEKSHASTDNSGLFELN